MTLRAGEVCAGYGGLALAVEKVFGAETAWVSEFEEAPSRILAHHWPTVPNHGDMTKIDWSAVEPVDIISGGTPCQDLSAAGRRKGMTEGTRSNLWVQMREAIATIKPTYVVWENVRGAYSAGAYSEVELTEGRVGGDGRPVLRALGRVLGDLSDLGYDCQWRGLRASDVGAPHKRFRVFVLATHRDRIRRERPGAARHGRDGSPDDHREAPDTSSDTRRLGHGDDVSPRCSALERGQGARRGSAPDSFSGGRNGRAREAGWEEGQRTPTQGPGEGDSRAVLWGEFEPAIRRWEATLGRRSPAPTEPTGRNGGEQFSARFDEWMMGVPDGWITDVPGITRNEALKAAGNGVVPQQAIAALRDMLAAQSIQRDVACPKCPPRMGAPSSPAG